MLKSESRVGLPWMRGLMGMAAVVALGGALLWPRVCGSAGMEVSPTLLEISPPQPAEGILLRNRGTQTIHAQVRVFAWSQKEGEDLLAPTGDLTISPPMLRIPPGGRQLLRVIRTSSRGDGVEGEKAYRLVVDELPLHSTALLDSESPRKAHSELSFLVRYSLPVFVGHAAPAGVPPVLQWSLDCNATPWALKVRNHGDFHAQIADLRTTLDDGSRVLVYGGLLGYVLAGQSMQWTITPLAHSRCIKGLDAMVNRNMVSVYELAP